MRVGNVYNPSQLSANQYKVSLFDITLISHHLQRSRLSSSLYISTLAQSPHFPQFWPRISKMALQTAAVVKNVGEPVTSISNWPIPQAGHSQVQVRVTIAGLNPHDQKGRDIGLFVKESLPAVLGSDVVGIVTALGEGTRRFKIGNRVFGQASIAPGSTSKGLQQYAVLDEDFIASVPNGITEDEAATLPTNLLAGA